MRWHPVLPWTILATVCALPGPATAHDPDLPWPAARAPALRERFLGTPAPALAAADHLNDPDHGWTALEAFDPQPAVQTAASLPCATGSPVPDPWPAGRWPSDLWPPTSDFWPSAPWTWQVLPDGVLYKAYLAGVKESRFSLAFLYSADRGWVWDNTLGGQVGVIRYGSRGAARPEGFQVDLEGAVFARLDVESKDDLESADFRIGVPFTWSRGNVAFKFGYFHFSSHLGDEFMLRHPEVPRINYVRDGVLWGLSVFLTDDLRAYTEASYAFHRDGGARPWEIQFGTELSPARSYGFNAVPFAAIHGNLRQEVNFGGNVNLVAGWQWRGAESDRLWRMGFQYFNGKSSQYAFFRRFEQLTGLGVWFDY